MLEFILWWIFLFFTEQIKYPALASCSSGWNCKKRYCDTQKKDIIKTQYITNAQLELVANP